MGGLINNAEGRRFKIPSLPTQTVSQQSCAHAAVQEIEGSVSHLLVQEDRHSIKVMILLSRDVVVLSEGKHVRRQVLGRNRLEVLIVLLKDVATRHRRKGF